MTLDIRPGTQSGEQLVLRGRGVPRLRGTGRGDVVTTVVVETPTRLDPEQTELIQQLAALRDEEKPVAAVEENRHRGVFGRFRDAFKN
jgi:molecular chaperone DnaJ